MEDNEYWEKHLLNTEECSDKLASSITQLKHFKEYADVINKVLPHVIESLDKERTKIVKEAENSFSDIMRMIDAINDIGDENTTYEMATKLCEFYKVNHKKQQGEGELLQVFKQWYNSPDVQSAKGVLTDFGLAKRAFIAGVTHAK